MTIKSIDILNVLTFQKQQIKSRKDTVDKFNDTDASDNTFHLKFGDGINVIIGENGVGKTSLLKMIYAATQWSNKNTNTGKNKDLLRYFSCNIIDSAELKNFDHRDECSYYKITDGEHKFEYDLSCEGKFDNQKWAGLNIQSVMIPTTEMLSHSRSFLALNEKFNMPFDETQIDIIVNASLPETRKIPDNMEPLLRKISEVIEGKIVFENDVFYVLKDDGRKTEFSLEAEGLRKLGLLWKLIRNGLLEKDSILLWDEPEANLNPELYPLVVEILLELQKNGVQIFLATHNYNFAKYLEIRRDNKEQVIFHNLYKFSPEKTENMGAYLQDDNHEENVIYSHSAYRLEELKDNHIILADSKLLDEVYDQ